MPKLVAFAHHGNPPKLLTGTKEQVKDVLRQMDDRLLAAYHQAIQGAYATVYYLKENGKEGMAVDLIKSLEEDLDQSMKLFTEESQERTKQMLKF